MKIPYSDLEDEVRDGFYVDSLMKCCWMAQLNVLEKIDAICRKHDIQYQAEWGTLLGTVRHGGFIPWDDDMDISMKRADYNKFLKVAQKELPEGYEILNYRNDNEYWDVMSRVVNSNAIRWNREYLDANCNFPFSAGIDIFPMDFLPTNEEEGEVLKTLVRNVKGVADAYGEGALNGEELEWHLNRLENLCNMKIDRKGNLREHLYDIVVSLYSLYTEKESEKLALMPLWIESGRHVYPKEYYSKTAQMPFDRIKIQVPIAYDSILKHKYSDYMKMVRKGGSHDYPYYHKQKKYLVERGIYTPPFEYSDRACRETKAENIRNYNVDLKNLVILEQIHLNIYKLLLCQEAEMTMQLLTQCQECAVAFGGSIEKTIVDNENIIRLLEEYCELIFQIYQLVQSGENPSPEGIYKILQEQYSVINSEVQKEHKWKKRIVFVTDKASRWKSLESVWKAAKEDTNNAVSVLVIPYVYKRIDGSILEEHYEGDRFPEYVEIVDYKTFNLEEYHPDIIYINNPYDKYNYLSSIHPHFYSSNLVKWCDKLVYIPWFVITELTREDERGWQSMQHFVTMPGVVNADKVIVQSEQMKQSYVDYLIDWAGEETRNIWEEKICGLGSPLLDMEEDQEELDKLISNRWKEHLYRTDGTRKKVILYSISSSSFIDYKQKAVDKLQRVLGIFKENKEDVCLLWYWDTTMEATLQLNYPEYWDAFQTIVNDYKKQSWGIYEDIPDKELMVRLSNAYYGDGCAISQAMVMAEKPVMLQNYEC